jgi:hypothetical protein
LSWAAVACDKSMKLASKTEANLIMLIPSFKSKRKIDNDINYIPTVSPDETKKL